MSQNPPPAEPIFTRNFILASLTSFSAFCSFYFLLAALPLYVISIGAGQAEVGLVLGVFALTAVVMRPLVGWASDRWGRRRLIILGAGGMLLASLGYQLTATVPLLVGLRVWHGVAWAGFGTSASALIADIVPVRRRGEAVGYYGMFANLAMAIGPAAGIFILQRSNFPVLFLSSAGAALLACLLSFRLDEPARSPTVGRGVLIERKALFPSTVLATLALSYGAVVTFVPLYALERGFENPGFFFTIYAIVVLAARGVTGRLSDRYGRVALIAPGLLGATVALAILSQATTPLLFVPVALIYGLAFAAAQPALMALTIDRVGAARRGAAMGTFGTFFDGGIGVGSFVWGVAAQSWGYSTMYLIAATAPMVGAGLLLGQARNPSKTASPQP